MASPASSPKSPPPGFREFTASEISACEALQGPQRPRVWACLPEPFARMVKWLTIRKEDAAAHRKVSHADRPRALVHGDPDALREAGRPRAGRCRRNVDGPQRINVLPPAEPGAHRDRDSPWGIPWPWPFLRRWPQPGGLRHRTGHDLQGQRLERGHELRGRDHAVRQGEGARRPHPGALSLLDGPGVGAGLSCHEPRPRPIPRGRVAASDQEPTLAPGARRCLALPLSCLAQVGQVRDCGSSALASSHP